MKLLKIEIKYEDADGQKVQVFQHEGHTLDDAMNLLVQIGVYDEILVTRRFSPSKEIISRLRGG